MKAIEVAGHIDRQRVLHLDEPLDVAGPRRVRVLVLVPEDDLSEAEWQQAVAKSPSFEFLRDPAEDIYSPADPRRSEERPDDRTVSV